MGLRLVRSSPTLLRSNSNALSNLATVSPLVYVKIGDSNVPTPIHGLDGRICVLLLNVLTPIHGLDGRLRVLLSTVSHKATRNNVSWGAILRNSTFDIEDLPLLYRRELVSYDLT